MMFFNCIGIGRDDTHGTLALVERDISGSLSCELIVDDQSGEFKSLGRVQGSLDRKSRGRNQVSRWAVGDDWCPPMRRMLTSEEELTMFHRPFLNMRQDLALPIQSPLLRISESESMFAK